MGLYYLFFTVICLQLPFDQSSNQRSHSLAQSFTYLLVLELQARLADSSGAQQTAEDVATCTSATLNSLKKKAHAYKKENKTLLTNYDDWLKTLVSQRGSIGAGYASDVSYDRL